MYIKFIKYINLFKIIFVLSSFVELNNRDIYFQPFYVYLNDFL